MPRWTPTTSGIFATSGNFKGSARSPASAALSAGGVHGSAAPAVCPFGVPAGGCAPASCWGAAFAAEPAWPRVLVVTEGGCDAAEFAAAFTVEAVLAAELATVAAFWTAFFLPKIDFRLDTALARPSGAPAMLPAPCDTPFARPSKCRGNSPPSVG